MAVTRNTPKWTFGDRLRKAREEAGFRQDQMAKILGVSPATISNWETDNRHARGGELKLAQRWAKETGVSEAWLLGVQP